MGNGALPHGPGYRAHPRLCHLVNSRQRSTSLALEAKRTLTEPRLQKLHRLRGEIFLTLGRRGEAEAGLRRALTIAQQQQARWWELRAATTLAKHWQDEGKHLEAYSLLQPVYGWFVEGFDTTPLKDAKAFLGE